MFKSIFSKYQIDSILRIWDNAPKNISYYIGTTLLNLNRASAAQTLTGVSISGNAGTVTNGFYNNSSFNLGTTSIPVNRASAAQTLTGVSISGNAGTVTNGFYNTSSFNLGTTSISVDRASATQNLTGVNIDGNAITSGTAGTVLNTNLGATVIGISTFTTPADYSKPAGYQTYLLYSSVNMPTNCSGANRMFGDWFAYNVIGKRDVSGGTYATLTSQNGSMWFTYIANSGAIPIWTKVQTNVNTNATYSGNTSATTTTSSGVITFNTVPTTGTSQTYTINNSYFTTAPIAQEAIIDFNIKYIDTIDPSFVLLLAGYFINSSGQIIVKIYNAGVGTPPASFKLCYNVIG